VAPGNVDTGLKVQQRTEVKVYRWGANLVFWMPVREAA
jgi:hypothetical protein